MTAAGEIKAGVRSTNIELDRDLLARAQDAQGGATIKDTVEEGLRRLVAEKALEQLAAHIGEMVEDPAQRELMYTVRDTAW